MRAHTLTTHCTHWERGVGGGGSHTDDTAPMGVCVGGGGGAHTLMPHCMHWEWVWGGSTHTDDTACIGSRGGGRAGGGGGRHTH